MKAVSEREKQAKEAGGKVEEAEEEEEDKVRRRGGAAAFARAVFLLLGSGAVAPQCRTRTRAPPHTHLPRLRWPAAGGGGGEG